MMILSRSDLHTLTISGLSRRLTDLREDTLTYWHSSIYTVSLVVALRTREGSPEISLNKVFFFLYTKSGYLISLFL